MCSYNFILDISLTAIYCWSELWGGEEKNSCNFPSPQPTQQLCSLKQDLCEPHKMGIIRGFTYVLS